MFSSDEICTTKIVVLLMKVQGTTPPQFGPKKNVNERENQKSWISLQCCPDKELSRITPQQLRPEKPGKRKISPCVAVKSPDGIASTGPNRWLCELHCACGQWGR